MLQGYVFLGWILGFCMSWIPMLRIWCPARRLESGLILGSLIWLGALIPLGWKLQLNPSWILGSWIIFLGALGLGVGVGSGFSSRFPSDPRIYRTGLHLMAGAILIVIGILNWDVALYISSAGFCFSLLGEVIRIQGLPGELSQFISRRFQPGLRAGEQKLYLESMGFMLGCLISLSIFQSLIPILVVTICDPVAAWMGRRWGSSGMLGIKLLDKSLAGSLGFFASCWGMLAIIGIPIPISGIIALGCCLAELVPRLDNLSVAICCGILIGLSGISS